MTVKTLARKPRKSPEWKGSQLRCGVCGREWIARKEDGELRSGRRCPNQECRARLVSPPADR